ncbi:mechanosensitive ion channel family protein [Xylanibacter oryzae]|uniref:mechanosensitive ion channel family protein n=1 Tax=Xylanibacter oryzae TaxID=185293 RepID=UPI0004BB36C1|nr:mechanosensitive ion channel domain-containing protein [Xylanibacter oryzae]
MEQIRIFVERIIQLCGVHGQMVPVTRHILLAVVAILLAWLSDFLCRKIFVPIIVKLTKKSDAKWDDVLLNKTVLFSACHIIPAIVIWKLLPMVFYQFPVVEALLKRFTSIYITIMSARLAIVFISSFKGLESERRSSVQQYFVTFCGVLKLLIVFITVIIVIATLINKSPFTLFAGLGATSAVLMFVFKDTISGLVAGVRLTSNNMLHKGDWITVQGTEANGVVEEISLTTVKIRNFDNTIITVSPQRLVEGSFQNWIGMQHSDGRRVKRMVYYDFRSVKITDDSIRENLVNKGYYKPEDIRGNEVNMSLYRKYMEKYLTSRDDVNSNMYVIVRQLEATNTGLPLEFCFFLKDKTPNEYEHNLADIMEYVYAITADFGLTIYQQYPEQ